MAKQAKKTKVKRTKTKYTNIYFNESTKRYDVKFNYTEYDVLKGKNVHKSKWAYGIPLLKDAQTVLADLQQKRKILKMKKRVIKYWMRNLHFDRAILYLNNDK